MRADRPAPINQSINGCCCCCGSTARSVCLYVFGALSCLDDTFCLASYLGLHSIIEMCVCMSLRGNWIIIPIRRLLVIPFKCTAPTADKEAKHSTGNWKWTAQCAVKFNRFKSNMCPCVWVRLRKALDNLATPFGEAKPKQFIWSCENFIIFWVCGIFNTEKSSKSITRTDSSNSRVMTLLIECTRQEVVRWIEWQ